MESENTVLFAISKVGASHAPKGIVCQDYSLSWCSEDSKNALLIVCDGHGSSTYVRSHVGSKLAAEIARDKIISFIDKTTPTLFLNKKGCVTARPSLDDKQWQAIATKNVKVMSESQLDLHRQNQQFFQQISAIRDQDSVLMDLFKEIYQDWLEAIKRDSQKNPFTEKELVSLSKNNIVKAYGTTLMAYVQTPFYWMAFHIGDGRLLTANRSLEWVQPVPWDCNCFQNVTTSLCNSNPLLYFRYAFDGTGYFPTAVICCSDGVEDSYGDFDLAPYYLCNFYNGLLNTLSNEGKEVFLDKLAEFLPKLSAAASKDDMSIAGYIKIDALNEGLQECDLRNQRDALNEEHANRLKKQRANESQLDKLQNELTELKEKLEDAEKRQNSFLEQLNQLLLKVKELRFAEKKEMDSIILCREQLEVQTEIRNNFKMTIAEELESHKKQDEDSRILKSQLKRQYDELEERISKLTAVDLENWNKRVTLYLQSKISTDNNIPNESIESVECGSGDDTTISEVNAKTEQEL